MKLDSRLYVLQHTVAVVCCTMLVDLKLDVIEMPYSILMIFGAINKSTIFWGLSKFELC